MCAFAALTLRLYAIEATFTDASETHEGRSWHFYQLTIAQGGSKACEIFVPGGPDRDIVDGCVGVTVRLRSLPAVQLAPEPLSQYHGRAGLLHSMGAWAHRTEHGLCADILFRRRIVELTIYRCEYRYLRGDFDNLTIVSQSLDATMVPQLVVPKPPGKTQRKPQDPQPPAKSFGSRFKRQGQEQEASDKRQKRQVSAAGKKPAPKRNEADKKVTLDEAIEDILELPAESIKSMFQPEGEDEIQAEEQADPDACDDPNEAGEDVHTDSDNDCAPEGDDALNLSLDDILATCNVQIHEILVPSHHWSIVRATAGGNGGGDGGGGGVTSTEIGIINPVGKRLKVTCKLHHAPLGGAKRCECWLGSRQHSDVVRAHVFRDVVAWVAHGRDGLAHSDRHHDDAELLKQKWRIIADDDCDDVDDDEDNDDDDNTPTPPSVVCVFVIPFIM